MALQNRVAPDGSLHASSTRCDLMGNRGGRMHDDHGQLKKRHWVNRQWIACETKFKDRKRTIWGNSYTELFFLDEVTALAAGHRPCFECRRKDADAFITMRPAAAFDRLLHSERMASHEAVAGELPDGAVIAIDDAFFARRKNQWLRWSFAGYTSKQDIAPNRTLRLLTPPMITAILATGYQPRWHSSAQQWDD